MKKLVIVFLVALFFCPLALLGQEPEFEGIFYFLSKGDSTSTPTLRLEQQECRVKAKYNTASYIPYANLVAGKHKTMCSVKGEQGSTRTALSDTLRVVVRVPNNRVNPHVHFNAFKMVVEKEKRYIFSEEYEKVPFAAERFGESSFCLTFTGLQPGEYAITEDGKRTLFNLFSLSE